jgi:lipoprotein signal peptidase
MLFFMVSSAHLATNTGIGFGMIGDASMTGLVVSLLIIAALELNGIFGKQGPMTTVRGVIGSSLVLTAVLWAVAALL